MTTASPALTWVWRPSWNTTGCSPRGRRTARAPDVPAWPAPQVQARTSPEVRAEILRLVKEANPKYARPFEKGRIPHISFVGTESWADYGQVVLQLAILDTLLSVEEHLAALPEHLTTPSPD